MILWKCKTLISSDNSDFLGSLTLMKASPGTLLGSLNREESWEVYNKNRISRMFQLHSFVNSFHRVLLSRMGLYNPFICVLFELHFFIVKINKQQHMLPVPGSNYY